MALSAKERQAKFREQKKLEQGKRLDLIVSAETAHQLEKLALHGNITKKEVLSQLIGREYLQKFNEPTLPPEIELAPIVAPSEPQDKPKDTIDHDWQTHGLNALQISKLWYFKDDFCDLNLHLLPKNWTGNYYDEMKLWEKDFKDPKKLQKFKGLAEVLAKEQYATLAPQNAPELPQDTAPTQGKVKTPPKAKNATQDKSNKSKAILSINSQKQAEADKFAREFAPIVKPLIGTMSKVKIVAYLNEQGINSPTGGKWHLSTFDRIIKRISDNDF